MSKFVERIIRCPNCQELNHFGKSIKYWLLFLLVQGIVVVTYIIFVDDFIKSLLLGNGETELVRLSFVMSIGIGILVAITLGAILSKLVDEKLPFESISAAAGLLTFLTVSIHLVLTISLRFLLVVLFGDFLVNYGLGSFFILSYLFIVMNLIVIRYFLSPDFNNTWKSSHHILKSCWNCGSSFQESNSNAGIPISVVISVFIMYFPLIALMTMLIQASFESPTSSSIAALAFIFLSILGVIAVRLHSSKGRPHAWKSLFPRTKTGVLLVLQFISTIHLLLMAWHFSTVYWPHEDDFVDFLQLMILAAYNVLVLIPLALSIAMEQVTNLISEG